MKTKTQHHSRVHLRRGEGLRALNLGRAGRVIAGVAATLTLTTSGVAAAQVTAGAGLASPYGEALRFGGYDSTGKVPGKFDYPVGFAVAPSEGNDIYVLDRVVDEVVGEETGKLGYRLQKLSSSGVPLGSVTLPVESYESLANYTDAHPLISLAVDASKKRVYAVVEGMVSSGGSRVVPVAQRIVAWSTEPNSKKELVPASGYKELDPVTGGALVAGASVLEPGTASEDLYAPEGISIDPANHNVVIEAQHGVNEAHGGPTILQRVPAEPSEAGKLGEQWIATTTLAPNNQQGDGVFTANDGSFGIDLYEEWGAISRLADVKANFKEPSAARIAEDKSGGANLDEAATIDNSQTINHNSNFGGQYRNPKVISPSSAGSPVAQLTNGLYAARFGQSAFEAIDFQSEAAPWNGVPVFWTQGNRTDDPMATEGIRIFNSSGSIVTTIGGQPSTPCNIATPGVAIAAASKEAVYVLTQPNAISEELVAGGGGDEVIEFAPGAKGACPQPSGTLTVNGKSGSSFSFPVGTEVTFADSVERKGEAPYRFDWGLLNAGTLEAEDLYSQMEGPNYSWPAPSKSHTFTKKGTYYLGATVYGDYGITTIGGVVTITIH